MKKRVLVAIALVVIASVVLAAPAGARQCDKMKPLVMIETMTAGLQDHPDTWYGNVKGDINGSQEGWNLAFDPATPEFGLVDPIFLGGVGPSYNLIITRCGVITFYTTGLYVEGSWEFRNVGFVTDATGKWKRLLGWVTYGYGFTTDPNTWGDTYTCTGYRVFLPPLPAKWGKLGVWKPERLWGDVFSK